MSRLTSKSYWDKTYINERERHISVDGFRNYCVRRIYETLCEIGLENKRILEVGAGDSLWLPFLAKQFPSGNFTGLDYSKIGCDRLKNTAAATGLPINVVHSDLFNPPKKLFQHYDVVISFGVVEHFEDLSQVVKALKYYVKLDGIIYSLIPNMAGIIGFLTRLINRSVYDVHNPHNINSFVEGHRKAGLFVMNAGYVCSNNFGLLSSCIAKDKKLLWQFYLMLSRLSKLSWLIESNLFKLPVTSFMSPYIYCVTSAGDVVDVDLQVSNS